MPTMRDLKAAADAALFADRAREALERYVQMVIAQPGSLDARLRVADALLANGQVQRAAVVYAALGRHAALSGHPLRALVALKMLATLEPKLGTLLQEVAALYGSDSARLGRSARRALPELDVPAPAPTALAVNEGELAAQAERVGAGYETAQLVYPEKLMPIPLLSLLPAADFGAVLSVVQLVRARPGTLIVREGDVGTSFFVLVRGQVSVSRSVGGKAQHLADLLEGSIFGEMALLSAAPRAATITATSDCDLLELDCNALSTASSTLQTLGGALLGFARERLLRNVVTTSPLFGPLDAKQRGDLLNRFVAVDAGPGELVLQQGATGAGLYVVLRGEVIVTRHDGSSESQLARLGPGELFGEISLLRNEPTTASVRAGALQTTLLFLSRDYFERLLMAVPQLRGYLEAMSEQRLLDLRLSMVPLDPSDAESADIEVEVEV